MEKSLQLQRWEQIKQRRAEIAKKRFPLLSERQRLVWKMLNEYGFSRTETAALLKVHLKTVDYAARRAKELLYPEVPELQRGITYADAWLKKKS